VKTLSLFLLRILAKSIDLAGLYLGSGIFYSWMTASIPMAHDRLFNGLTELMYYLPICIFYTPLCEGLTGGYTVGKFLCRIRVCKIDGTPIGFREAILRWMGALADFTLTLGGVAVIAFFRSKRGQRSGDLLANTLVLPRND
jgi:uncharacterized RDD family membrane protein YckC